MPRLFYLPLVQPGVLLSLKAAKNGGAFFRAAEIQLSLQMDQPTNLSDQRGKNKGNNRHQFNEDVN